MIGSLNHGLGSAPGRSGRERRPSEQLHQFAVRDRHLALSLARTTTLSSELLVICTVALLVGVLVGPLSTGDSTRS